MTSATQLLEHSVVVFSRNYLPTCRINIKRAIVLLILGKAEALDLARETWRVKSSNLVIAVPQHLRLTTASTERIWKIPPVNRREVLKRDNYRYQYCGSNKCLTLDRVIPVSQGGGHKWNNVVTACKPCNQRKRDRTPAETGIPFSTKPKAPMHPTVAFAENFWQGENACSPEKDTQGQC